MTYDIVYDIGMMSAAVVRSMECTVKALLPMLTLNLNQKNGSHRCVAPYVPDGAHKVGPRTIVNNSTYRDESFTPVKAIYF